MFGGTIFCFLTLPTEVMDTEDMATEADMATADTVDTEDMVTEADTEGHGAIATTILTTVMVTAEAVTTVMDIAEAVTTDTDTQALTMVRTTVP